jgi:hypothetical protein
MAAQADLWRAQGAQALLRLAQACSPSPQVKAVAHVRRLKRNQRKGKLILSLGVSDQVISLTRKHAYPAVPPQMDKRILGEARLKVDASSWGHILELFN